VYRRRLADLETVLPAALAVLPLLDPIDTHVKAGDLIDMLEEAISTLEHLLAHIPLPNR
jgi:hypothetical protein